MRIRRSIEESQVRTVCKYISFIWYFYSFFQVIVRLRGNEHLRCLSQHLSDWKDGKFTTDNTRKN